MRETLDGILSRLRPRLLPPRPWQPGRTGERQAAVLVPLMEVEAEPALLFIRRAEGLDLHAGQVAFPGGNRNVTDADPVATALREGHEEVGLAPEDAEVLGLLPDVLAVSTGFRITGVVSRLPAGLVLRPDPREVAEVFTVPLAAIADPTIYREEVRSANGLPRRVPYFHVAPHTVWGATGRLVQQFLEHLTS